MDKKRNNYSFECLLTSDSCRNVIKVKFELKSISKKYSDIYFTSGVERLKNDA